MGRNRITSLFLVVGILSSQNSFTEQPGARSFKALSRFCSSLLRELVTSTDAIHAHVQENIAYLGYLTAQELQAVSELRETETYNEVVHFLENYRGVRSQLSEALRHERIQILRAKSGERVFGEELSKVHSKRILRIFRSLEREGWKFKIQKSPFQSFHSSRPYSVDFRARTVFYHPGLSELPQASHEVGAVSSVILTVFANDHRRALEAFVKNVAISAKWSTAELIDEWVERESRMAELAAYSLLRAEWPQYRRKSADLSLFHLHDLRESHALELTPVSELQPYLYMPDETWVKELVIDEQCRNERLVLLRGPLAITLSEGARRGYLILGEKDPDSGLEINLPPQFLL